MSDPKNKKELKEAEQQQRKSFYKWALIVVVFKVIDGAFRFINQLILATIFGLIPNFFVIPILTKSFFEIRKLMLTYHKKEYQKVKLAMWVYFIFDLVAYTAYISVEI